MYAFVRIPKRVKSYNGSKTVARTRHTDWRPTDVHTRTDSSKVSDRSSRTPDIAVHQSITKARPLSPSHHRATQEKRLEPSIVVRWTSPAHRRTRRPYETRSHAVMNVVRPTATYVPSCLLQPKKFVTMLLPACSFDVRSRGAEGAAERGVERGAERGAERGGERGAEREERR